MRMRYDERLNRGEGKWMNYVAWIHGVSGRGVFMKGKRSRCGCPVWLLREEAKKKLCLDWPDACQVAEESGGKIEWRGRGDGEGVWRIGFMLRERGKRRT